MQKMTTDLDILATGMRLWSIDPAKVTVRRIARELGISHGTVLYRFRNSKHSLKDAIAYHAVKCGESRVIVHLIAMQHKSVASMDDATRLEHMRRARRG